MIDGYSVVGLSVMSVVVLGTGKVSLESCILSSKNTCLLTDLSDAASSSSSFSSLESIG